MHAYVNTFTCIPTYVCKAPRVQATCEWTWLSAALLDNETSQCLWWYVLWGQEIELHQSHLLMFNEDKQIYTKAYLHASIHHTTQTYIHIHIPLQNFTHGDTSQYEMSPLKYVDLYHRQLARAECIRRVLLSIIDLHTVALQQASITDHNNSA